MSLLSSRVVLDVTPEFKVGDPCPEGYISRQEWAQVHMDAGQKQEVCGQCGLWQFPHELHPDVIVSFGSSTKAKCAAGIRAVRMEDRVCLKCHEKIERRRKERDAKL